MSLNTLPTANVATHLHLLDLLAALSEQAEGLAELVASGGELPAGVAADALAVLGRLDEDLSQLLDRVSQAGPG
jgi:hypothetical protein